MFSENIHSLAFRVSCAILSLNSKVYGISSASGLHTPRHVHMILGEEPQASHPVASNSCRRQFPLGAPASHLSFVRPKRRHAAHLVVGMGEGVLRLPLREPRLSHPFLQRQIFASAPQGYHALKGSATSGRCRQQPRCRLRRNTSQGSAAVVLFYASGSGDDNDAIEILPPERRICGVAPLGSRNPDLAFSLAHPWVFPDTQLDLLENEEVGYTIQESVPFALHQVLHLWFQR